MQAESEKDRRKDRRKDRISKSFILNLFFNFNEFFFIFFLLFLSFISFLFNLFYFIFFIVFLVFLYILFSSGIIPFVAAFWARKKKRKNYFRLVITDTIFYFLLGKFIYFKIQKKLRSCFKKE